MTDKQTMDDVHILYICSYGQTGLPICVDLEHRYCKLKSQKSKKCNLRPVVSYKDYKRKEQECEELKKQLQGDNCLIITSIGKINYQLLQKYYKLKTILTEIKYIAEHCIKKDICTICDYSEKCHIEDEEIPTYDVCKLILQKISEVNNDR